MNKNWDGGERAEEMRRRGDGSTGRLAERKADGYLHENEPKRKYGDSMIQGL
jgi:hypothetical protein